jgi:alkane 1-monooxygenase
MRSLQRALARTKLESREAPRTSHTNVSSHSLRSVHTLHSTSHHAALLLPRMNVFAAPTPKPEREQSADELASHVKVFPYALCFILHAVGLANFYGYLPLSPYFGVIFVFVLIPIMDALGGLDAFNPQPKVYVALERRVAFRFVPLLWLPVQVAFVLWACWVALPQVVNDSTRWYCLLFDMGISSAISINVAHELIHKNTALEHWSGALLLSLCSYGHFTVEHLDGHHRRVSTLEDPASSRLNESVFMFIPRSIIFGFISALKLDLPKSALLFLATVAFALVAIPRASVPFFVAQGLVGATFLELINYIEHYGLSREPDEPVTPMHSWNAGHRVTNYFLLKLQRHSDHHANAGRRYQSLRSWPWSPQLPAGYATMILLALVPPLFFRVMNPRVAHAQKIAAELKKKGLDQTVFTDAYLESHDFFSQSKEAGWE